LANQNVFKKDLKSLHR